MSVYFLEELKIKKNIIEYKLEKENILGNLTEYNYSDYINNEKIPRKGDYNNTNKTKTQIFRLDLFNNKTLHYELNIIYFNIILPFVEENIENFYSILSFEKVEFKEGNSKVIFNCIGREKTKDEQIPKLLEKQVQSSVYLEDSIKYMADAGVDTIIEIGPGKAISKFISKTVDNVKVYSIDTVEDFENTLEELA